jgi:hypothetical protein
MDCQLTQGLLECRLRSGKHRNQMTVPGNSHYSLIANGLQGGIIQHQVEIFLEGKQTDIRGSKN